MKNIVKMIKKLYLKGIEDCLAHVLNENLSMEKINELYLEIKESRSLNFEKKIIDIALE